MDKDAAIRFGGRITPRGGDEIPRTSEREAVEKQFQVEVIR